jgi:two-component sensor histidine kinase
MSIADGIRTLPTRAVVEEAPQGASPTYEVVLPGLRIRQQKLLAQLGVDALARVPIPDLLQRGAEAAALGLDARFCKVCQYVPAENRLVMRAGVGWQPGCLNNASVGADLESPSGFALKTGRPVISNHLEHEERFRTPDLLRQHGIRRAINVILQGEGSPYGVLEVDSELEGQFNADDIHFLQGAANILGMALERDLHDKKLRQALEYQQMLVGEIDHRVKNSLQLVSSVLQLQAAVSEDSALTRSLNDAIARVTAVARVHERLSRTPQFDPVNLSDYLDLICRDLEQVSDGAGIDFTAEEPVFVNIDRSVRLALLTTELVTNAVRHAFTPQAPGRITIKLALAGQQNLVLSVRDNGKGLNSSGKREAEAGLGLKLVAALVKQLGADVEIVDHQPGTEFVITAPVEPGRTILPG